jgi:hypothetical protein
MTTIRELVTQAFRENNLIQVGDVPDGAEYAEAELRLVRFIRSLFGYEFGDTLENISVTSSSESLNPNSRIILGATSPVSVTLSDHPNDGERFGVLDPKGLLTSFAVIAGAGTIEEEDEVELTTANVNAEWFYRADVGNWYRVTDLTADDESPFPVEFDDLLVTWLAMRIAPQTGAQTKPEGVQVYNRIKKMFNSRFKQTYTVFPDDALTRTASLRNNSYTLTWS